MSLGCGALKVLYRSAKGFRELLAAVAVINEEQALVFDEGGLSCASMDSEHVSMVELCVPACEFDEYQVHERVVVPVNVAEVVRMLKRVKDESLELELDAKRERLVLTLRGGITRVKEVPVLEPLEEEIPKPRIFFKASARVVSAEIQRLVLPDLKDLSEHCCVSIDGEELVFSAAGAAGSCRVPYGRHHDHMLELQCDEPSKTTFGVGHLVNIFKGFKPLAEVVELKLATDMPIRVEPELPVGSLVYHLAPYVGV